MSETQTRAVPVASPIGPEVPSAQIERTPDPRKRPKQMANFATTDRLQNLNGGEDLPNSEQSRISPATVVEHAFTSASDGTWRTELIKNLLQFNEANFNYNKQKLDSSTLKTIHEGAAEKRCTVELNGTDHPSLLKYAISQEQETQRNYEKAAIKTKALKPAAQSQAEVLINGVFKRVKQLLDSPIVSTPGTVKSDVDSLRQQLNHLAQSSQSQSEVSVQLTRTSQSFLTRLSSIESIQTEKMKREDEHNGKVKEAVSEMDKIRAENAVLRKEIKDIRANSVTLQQLEQFKAGFVPRQQFDRLSKSLEQTRAESIPREQFDQLKMSLENPARAPPPPPSDASTIPEAYVNRYNEDRQSLQQTLAAMSSQVQGLDLSVKGLEKDHDKSIPLIHEINGANKGLNSRMDNIITQFGLLEEKVRTAPSTVAPAYPSPPIPSHQTTSKVDIELQKYIVASNNQFAKMTNEINANSHAVRALNSRYNNLTTEALYRQIAGIVMPMIPQLQ